MLAIINTSPARYVTVESYHFKHVNASQIVRYKKMVMDSNIGSYSSYKIWIINLSTSANVNKEQWCYCFVMIDDSFKSFR